MAGSKSRTLVTGVIGSDTHIVGKRSWQETERTFLDMGFDRAFPPGTRTEAVIETLNRDFMARASGQRIASS